MQMTVRLTMAQALARFLTRQMTVIDGQKVPLFAGVWAIFGHGNVAGMGEALYGVKNELPTYRAHNEQAMAHSAIAFAKASRRRRMMAVTSSIGPGATNIVTAAAVAHGSGPARVLVADARVHLERRGEGAVAVELRSQGKVVQPAAAAGHLAEEQPLVGPVVDVVPFGPPATGAGQFQCRPGSVRMPLNLPNTSGTPRSAGCTW